MTKQEKALLLRRAAEGGAFDCPREEVVERARSIVGDDYDGFFYLNPCGPKAKHGFLNGGRWYRLVLVPEKLL